MLSNGVSLNLDFDVLRPLIEKVVSETVQHLSEAQAGLGDRLGYSEAEAAALLGLESHVLRDERRRGRIKAYVIVGRRVRYARQDLIDYLAREQWTKETARRRQHAEVGNGLVET